MFEGLRWVELLWGEPEPLPRPTEEITSHEIQGA